MTNIIAILLLYKCHLPVVAIENIENTVLSGVAKTRTHSQSLLSYIAATTVFCITKICGWHYRVRQKKAV